MLSDDEARANWNNSKSAAPRPKKKNRVVALMEQDNFRGAAKRNEVDVAAAAVRAAEEAAGKAEAELEARHRLRTGPDVVRVLDSFWSAMQSERSRRNLPADRIGVEDYMAFFLGLYRKVTLRLELKTAPAHCRPALRRTPLSPDPRCCPHRPS